MKRTLLIIGVLVLVVTTATIYRIRVSGEKAGDVSCLTGIYEGEATLVIPAHLKKMAENIQVNGQKAVLPDGPIPCKVELKVCENNNISMELVDFKMPIEGMKLPQAICSVTRKEKIFNLDGKGNINYEDKKLNFSHKGTIQDGELAMDLTLVVVPFMVEPKVVFKGKKV